MIKYEYDDDNDLVIIFDDETLMGTYVRLNMGDDKGLEMMLTLAKFYELKGHNTRRLLENFFREQEEEARGFRPATLPGSGSIWKRIKKFLGGE